MSFDSAASSPSANSAKKRGLSETSGKTSAKKSTKKSPFDDFGSYMVEKNRKLREQFDADASASSSGGGNEGIFKDVCIFVDGFTVPSSQELKVFMLKHGGRFENYFSRHRVTHIICSNLPDSKMRNFRAFSRGLPVVKPAWILESLVAKKLLNWVPYQLRELASESGKQRKLSSFFVHKSISSSNNAGNTEDPCARLDTECHDAPKQLSPLVESSFLSFGREHDDDSACIGHQIAREEEEIAEPEFNDQGDELSFVGASNSSSCSISDKVNSMNNINFSPTKFLGTSNRSHSTLGDPNFVENYFKNSRLHFIGTWRNRYRKRFCNKSNEVKHSNTNVNSISMPRRTSVIHIDMDSFFVSVVIRNYPELADKPVAVCHSDSPKGTAEISSANYPAREYGIQAGMFVRDAKGLCPQLVTVPYDFESYEEVADQFYSILHKHCNKVQAVSCDEAFLDVTESANNDPENFALMVRNEIAEMTRCTASAGIAENMLLARLATRSAKPNGQCSISPEEVDSYLEDLPIKVLPGVGHSLGEKLKDRQIHTCGQLRLISKETLHKEFGLKTGDMLWNHCRGIDKRVVEVLQETKSIGAEVNWGVRFNDIAECDHFLLNLCKEVSFRLQECGMDGRTITLKVRKRRKGAEEPAKFMGCGDCECMSRSITVPLATDDTLLLQRLAKQIFASFHIDIKDIRGVGLQISRLESAGSCKKGRGKNALQCWLTSQGKTKGQLKADSCAPNLGNNGGLLFPEEKHNHQTQVDADCQQCSVNENLPPRTGHINLSDEGSHEDMTLLPELCHLDIEVIRNLPADVFQEMDAMYNGKLCDFMKKFMDEEGITAAKSMEPPLEAKDTAWSAGYQKIGFDVPGNTSAGQTSCLKSSSDSKNKGKNGLCSPNLPVCILPSQNEAPVEHAHRTFCSNLSNSNSSDFSEGGRSVLGNATPIGSDKICGSSKTHSVVKSTINMWTGKPPIWVEMFKTSNSLLLNLIGNTYAKSGGSCNLSYSLQSLFSCYLPDFDLISEGWDEALSSLSELILQYIDIKIESDIEELYICFRLLKRFASTSKFLLELYNIVLPPLQISVNEQYGGQLQLSFCEQ